MAVVQVIMQYSRTITGKVMQNVHYFEGANLDAGDFSALSLTVRDAFNGRLANRLPSTFTLRPFLCRLVSVQGSPFVQNTQSAITGADASDNLGTRTTVLAAFQRSAPSPNTKRMYIGFWGEGQNSASAPVSGLVGDIGLFCDDMLSVGSVNSKACQYAIGRYIGTPAYMPTAFPLDTRIVYPTWADLRSRR